MYTSLSNAKNKQAKKKINEDTGRQKVQFKKCRDEEWPPLATARESPRTETKTQHSHKQINKIKKKKKQKTNCLKKKK